MQNTNLPKTEMVKTYKDLMEMLLRDDITVTSMKDVSGAAMCLTYKNKETNLWGGARTNYPLSAFVLANARAVLYRPMHILQKNCMYCDTGNKNNWFLIHLLI